MIGYLNGKIILKTSSYMLIDIGNIGYKVYVGSKLNSKYKQSENIIVYTYTHVREDLIDLYGFDNIKDLELFELLIGVSGIGCKTALGIFDKGTSEQITQAILKADINFFTGVPRLGKKNAQKLVIELKSKLSDSVGDINQVLGDEGYEIESALRSMGYTQREANQAAVFASSKASGTEERLKIALKYLGGKV